MGYTQQRRNNNFRSTGFYSQNTQDDIVITQHVMERMALRNQKDKNNPEALKRAVIQQVKQSKVIAMKGNEEHRSYFGNIYVCKRESGILRDKLVVVTLKLSDIKQRQNFSNNFSQDNIDYKAMDTVPLDKSGKFKRAS